MNRTLFTVLLAGAVSSAAFGEGAVAQAPSKLLALTDLDNRVIAASQAKASSQAALQTTAQFEAVAEKLSEQLDAQLRERMQRELAVAMQ